MAELLVADIESVVDMSAEDRRLVVRIEEGTLGAAVVWR